MDKKVKEKIVCFFPRSQSSFDDLWLRSFFTALSLSLSLLSTRSRALPPSPVPSLSAIASVRRLPLLSPHLKEKHSHAGEERKLFS